jgi:cytochrome c oxidase subunit 2
LFPALAGSAIANGEAESFAHQILNGKNMMPPFKDQLSDTDIASVMTYVRNSWGNAADAVQPAAVNAAR